MTLSGVIDQHINGAECRFNVLDNTRDGRRIGQVQLTRMGVAGLMGFESVHCACLPYGTNNLMSLVQCRFSQRLAETATDPGNEDCLGLIHNFILSRWPKTPYGEMAILGRIAPPSNARSSVYLAYSYGNGLLIQANDAK